MTLSVGSLCTGYGGLEMALTAAGVDHELAFVADPDLAASKVLAHHHPDVPNLGDITKVDWTTVGRVDILTAGYPCQPLSLAGRRAGVRDERWIWNDVFAAIRDLRPRIVLLENVTGHLSLGFGRILGDLASIGFDARWMCLRASDIGAAHRRERVFVWAYPADAAGQRHGDSGAQGVGRLQTAAEPGRAAALIPTPGARLGKCTNITAATAQRRLTRGRGVNLDDWAALLPTPNARDWKGPNPYRRQVCLDDAINQLTHLNGWTLADVAHADRWGHYAPAITRWGHVIGRAVPEPTEPSRSNAVRLAPRFVEWLMGLPAGWVTDVAGLTRNDKLRLLGNGVVPQQGAEAIRCLALTAGGTP